MLVHSIVSKILMGLIVLHVAGVIVYKLKTDSAISDRMWFGK